MTQNSHPTAGSLPEHAATSDVRRFVKGLKSVTGFDLTGRIVGELGSLSGIFLFEFAKEFPNIKGCVGIDCAMPGTSEVKYGSFRIADVPVHLYERDLLTVSSANVDFLIVSNASMNDVTQLCAAKIAVSSPQVRYLAWFNCWSLTDRRYPRVMSHISIGGYLGHGRTNPLLAPVFSSKIRYPESYDMHVFDLGDGDTRRNLIASFDEMMRWSAGYLKANGELANETTEALNGPLVWMPTDESIPRLREKRMCQALKFSTWKEALDRNWRPNGALLSNATLSSWGVSRSDLQQMEASARAFKTQMERFKKLAESQQRALSQLQAARHLTETQEHAAPTTPVSPPIGLSALDNARQCRTPIAAWPPKGRQRKFVRKVWRQLCDWANVNENNPADISSLLTGILGEKRVAELLRGDASADPSDIVTSTLRATLKLRSYDERKDVIRQLATTPIGAVDPSRKVSMRCGKIDPANRQWTFANETRRTLCAWLKLNAFSPFAIAMSLDALAQPQEAANTFFTIGNASNIDVISSRTGVGRAMRAIEGIEQRTGVALRDTLKRLAMQRERGQEAWHFELADLLADDWRAYGGGRTSFDIKVTGDKAVIHDNMGLFVYGYSLCDRRIKIDHQGLDAQRVAGMYLTNCVGNSKKGDSLNDILRWCSAFYASVKDIGANGIDVDGTHVDINVRWGGDWAFLVELLGLAGESFSSEHACCCAECPAKHKEWTLLGPDGKPKFWERTLMRLLPQYEAELARLEAKSGKIRVLEAESFPNSKIRAMKTDELLALYNRIKSDYDMTEEVEKQILQNKSLAQLSTRGNKSKLLVPAVLRIIEYFSLTASSLLSSGVSADGRIGVSNERLRSILRLRRNPANACSGGSNTLIDQTRAFLCEREEVVYAYFRVHMLTKRRAENAVTYDNIGICVAHCNCRLRCSLIDIILAKGVERIGVDETNAAFAAMLNKNEMQSASFHVLMDGKEHKRPQSLIWQDAARIMKGFNLDPFIDRVFAPETAERVKLLRAILEEYCALIAQRADFTQEDLEHERGLADSWGSLAIDLFGEKMIRLYSHKAVAGHINWHMRQLGNLYSFSNQGWEGKIRDLKRYLYNCTAKGGYAENTHDLYPEVDADGTVHAIVDPKRYRHRFLLLPLMLREQRLTCVRTGRIDPMLEQEKQFCDVHGKPMYASAKEFVSQLKRKRGEERLIENPFKRIYKKRRSLYNDE